MTNAQLAFEILSIEETNSFADPRKANNGGGYSQPHVTFRIGDKIGHFFNDSCGGFGSSYTLEFDNKIERWGSMLDDFEVREDFTGKEPYFKILNVMFFRRRYKFFKSGVITLEDIEAKEKDDEIIF